MTLNRLISEDRLFCLSFFTRNRGTKIERSALQNLHDSFSPQDGDSTKKSAEGYL
jgi:hypothetical protein